MVYSLHLMEDYRTRTWAEATMLAWDWEAQMLTERISALSEPYQQNAIVWLESCTQKPLLNLQSDLRWFLAGLHPIVRESFILHTRWILDEAVAYFGRQIPMM